jgi:hypothetical protein
LLLLLAAAACCLLLVEKAATVNFHGVAVCCEWSRTTEKAGLIHKHLFRWPCAN